MDRIVKLGYAKINLTLDVLGKREDGFHEVEMVMQSIDLADRIEMTKQDTISISCSQQDVPLDSTNLVYRAAEALKEYAGYKGGVHIDLQKQIPVAAGLAGGSTDAAATLKGLNQLWELGLSEEELAKIGASLGSDIPFCIKGGTSVARGRGEKLQPITNPPTLDLILIKPNFSVSTKEVYGAFDITKVNQKPDTDEMVEAIENGDIFKIAGNLRNVLESVTLEMHPEISELKEKLLAAGARAALMSGSGPTIFAIADNGFVAEKIAEKVRQDGLEVIITRTINPKDIS